jgi:transcriptional regulator with XRE-family HTH domain
MFAENLKRLREAAGLTQKAFAERLGIPIRTVQNWEQGHREPRIATLAPLARALGASVDALVGQAEQPSRPSARTTRPTRNAPKPARRGK